jgi:hypothetical protein
MENLLKKARSGLHGRNATSGARESQSNLVELKLDPRQNAI